MKPLTPREAMQALLDGKKIMWDSAGKEHIYIYLTDEGLKDHYGVSVTPLFNGQVNKFYLYEEPKPKVKKWLWRYLNHGCNVWRLDTRLMDSIEADNYFEGQRHEKYGEPIEVEE